MKKNRFIQICEYLSQIVQRKEQVSEEIMSEYVSELARIAQKQTKKQDFSFYELENRCRTYQTYQMKESESFAFMLGNIMGATSLFQQICREKDLKTYEERVLSPTSIQFLALELISENPGISRKELCEKIPGARSSSALSHLTGLLKREQYITAQKVGQEKRFFATTRGDEFIRSVRQQNDSQAEQGCTAMDSNTIERRGRFFYKMGEEDNYSTYVSSNVQRGGYRLGLSDLDSFYEDQNDFL